MLARVGVGVANLIYATTTLLAFATVWIFPGLASASTAQFVEMPLKHALKTPLSVLFYGAEPPERRIAARSLLFGIAIPAAAVTAGLGFRSMSRHIELISILGVCLAIAYLGICAWQNRRYAQDLLRLLTQISEFDPGMVPANPQKNLSGCIILSTKRPS